METGTGTENGNFPKFNSYGEDRDGKQTGTGMGFYVFDNSKISDRIGIHKTDFLTC